jgi:hypothetical protein
MTFDGDSESTQVTLRLWVVSVFVILFAGFTAWLLGWLVQRGESGYTRLDDDVGCSRPAWASALTALSLLGLGLGVAAVALGCVAIVRRRAWVDGLAVMAAGVAFGVFGSVGLNFVIQLSYATSCD